jgi:hypothetical protein
MGFSRGPKIVTDGLVLALDAGSKKSYPGSGTVVTDLTSRLSGNMSNGPTFQTDNSGVISFDGSNDRLTFTHNSEFDVDGSFSVDLWFYGGNGASNYGGLFCKSGNGNFGNWGLYGDNLNDYVRFGYVSTNGSQRECSNSSYSDISTPGWYYYCGTYDGSTIRLYRNGVQIAFLNISASHQTPDSNTYDVGIGWRPGSNSYYVNYKVGAAKLYNGKGLTPQEVLQNYNATKSRFI